MERKTAKELFESLETRQAKNGEELNGMINALCQRYRMHGELRQQVRKGVEACLLLKEIKAIEENINKQINELYESYNDYMDYMRENES